MVELANHMEAIWNKQYCHLLVTQLMSTGYCNIQGLPQETNRKYRHFFSAYYLVLCSNIKRYFFFFS